MENRPSANAGLSLVRVTEAVALAAGRWIGLGQREEAHAAATQAMTEALNETEINGRIVVGEESRLGEHTPLDSGTTVGTGQGPLVDVIVDPIDGTRLVVKGHPGAISLVALTVGGGMWRPPPEAAYMEKIVVDREAAAALVPECMTAPAAWTLALIARVKHKPVRDLTVIILDRPRHRDLIQEIRRAGARILLRSEGDAAGALEAAIRGTGVDILMGIGGVSEGLIAACAVKALGGGMLARLAPQREEERALVRAAGFDSRQILNCSELVNSDEIFFSATGITDSTLLRSVHYHGRWAETDSLLLRSSTGTKRFIHTEHLLIE
jgi:fructose-1,6-bisphosphatase II